MISVVVCTKNRCDNLKRYLPSLLNQTYKDFEVIILDNGSTDNTKETVEEFGKKHNNIRYFFYPQKGLAISRQYAFDKARGEVIVSIDDDCTVETDFLYQIKKTFEKNKNIGIVGGNVINIGFTGNARWKGLGYLDKYGRYHVAKDRSEATIFGSANLSIKKSIFEEVGGFDPLFYLLEEADLCCKVRKSGYKLIYNPKIVIRHFYTPKEEKKDLYRLRYSIKAYELRFYLFLKYLYKNDSSSSFCKLLIQELYLLFQELYDYDQKLMIRAWRPNKSQPVISRISKDIRKPSLSRRLLNVIFKNFSIILSRFTYPTVFFIYLKNKKLSNSY